jgi:MYXO-CTERM domain-containing protein
MFRSALAAAAALLVTGQAHATLLAHYTFDGPVGAAPNGTVITDASGNGRNLTIQGAGGSQFLATGAFGGSIQLGTNAGALARTGGVQSATIASFNTVTGNQVTISAWVKPNRESQGSSVFWISDNNAGSGNRIFQSHVEWTNGRIYWDTDWGDGTNQRVDAVGGTTADQLHHYVYTYNGDTGLMQIHKDNTLLATSVQPLEAGLPWASIRNFEIGALSFASWWGGGQVDDFAIWNEVLDEREIAYINRNGVAALPSLPEPASAGLALLGVAGLLARRRR